MFSSLPADARVRHALALNPQAGKILANYHQVLLRDPDSPLSVAERELIATYVSGLNACSYCHGTHKATAAACGVDGGHIEELIADPDLARASERLRPLLAFVRKLTLDQNAMTPADALAVYAAGWSERALHDAICVACTFNFMNRFVHGHGIVGDPAIWREGGQYLFEHGYAGVVQAATAGSGAPPPDQNRQ